MFFYIIIALQVYCLYHLYSNARPYYWIFIILFLPALGSIVYIITQVINKQGAEKIQSNVTSIINPTRKIKDLEKNLEFSDSYGNRMDLADAYFEIEDYQNAIAQYKIMLENKVQNDWYARQQLVECFFKLNDFESVIEQGINIKDKTEFKTSKSQFYYGIALYKTGDITAAEEHLKTIDKPYSNYEERLGLAKFYLDTNKEAKAKILLQEIAIEGNYMTKPNQRLFGSTISEVDRLLKTL